MIKKTFIYSLFSLLIISTLSFGVEGVPLFLNDSDEPFLEYLGKPPVPTKIYDIQPHSLSLLSDNQLVFLEQGNYRIVRMDTKGKILNDLPYISYSTNATIGPDGKFYVISMPNIIEEYSATGRLQKRIKIRKTLLSNVKGFIANEDGSFYIAIHLDEQLYPNPEDQRDHIYHYDPKGKLVKEWGGIGNLPGMMHGITDMQIGPEGNIWVTERINQRIQVFTKSGNHVKFINFSDLNIDSVYPTFIRFFKNKDFIIGDHYSDKIIHFSSDNQKIREWFPGIHYDSNSPTISGIAVDANDDLYIADSHNQTIVKFNSIGNFLRKYSLNLPSIQTSASKKYYTEGNVVTAGPENTVFLIAKNDDLVQINESGKLIRKFNPGDTNHPNDYGPRAVTYSSNENILVYYSPANTVVKYNNKGTIMMSWEPRDEYGSYLTFVKAIAEAPGGDIYLADNYLEKVFQYSHEGEFIRAIDVNNSSVKGLEDIAMTAKNRLMALEQGVNELHIYFANGELEKSLNLNTYFSYPFLIENTPDEGFIISGYKVGSSDYRIVKFDKKYEVEYILDDLFKRREMLNAILNPAGIAALSDGRLWSCPFPGKGPAMIINTGKTLGVRSQNVTLKGKIKNSLVNESFQILIQGKNKNGKGFISATGSNEKGKFEIPGLPLDADITLRISGYREDIHTTQDAEISFTTTKTKMFKNFDLSPFPADKVVVYGRVTDKFGNPISGVRIRLDQESTHTNYLGQYWLPVPLNSRITIKARKPGYTFKDAERNIKVKSGDIGNIDFIGKKK